MGYMNSIALSIDEIIEIIDDRLEYKSTADSVVLISGLIDKLENKRRALVDKFEKEENKNDK